MHATLPLLQPTTFPPLRRGQVTTLQVNLGYRCNQACLHCHVNAGPTRKETMELDTIEHVVLYLRKASITTLDVTGGAPELNPHFRHLVRAARELEKNIIDRCNLTILEQPGQEDLAEFLAANRVDVVASLPCYEQGNVDQQRGDGVFASSIRGLQRLNQLGYGIDGSGLILNLVYNPLGAKLPPPQAALETAYKTVLRDRHNIAFNHLFTLTNMPIQRFGSTLISHGEFQPYIELLKSAHQDSNLGNVMCKTTLSIDWQGFAYDCDFNQMLGLHITSANDRRRTHVSELLDTDIAGHPIRVAEHCYGCTAGQGSSCGGALA